SWRGILRRDVRDRKCRQRRNAHLAHRRAGRNRCEEGLDQRGFTDGARRVEETRERRIRGGAAGRHGAVHSVVGGISVGACVQATKVPSMAKSPVVASTLAPTIWA